MSTTNEYTIETIGAVTFAKTVRDLKRGERGWIVPWTLGYNEQGQVASIDMDATIHYTLGGTADVEIERLENGYLVNLTRTTHQEKRVGGETS